MRGFPNVFIFNHSKFKKSVPECPIGSPRARWGPLRPLRDHPWPPRNFFGSAHQGEALQNYDVLSPPARGLAKPVRSGGRQ